MLKIKLALQQYGTILRILFSIIIIVFILVQPSVDVNSVVNTIKNLNLIFISPYIFLRLVSVVLINLRLQYILKMQNVDGSIWGLIKLYFVGKFYNQFLPSQYGGDIIKAYILSKKEQDKIPSYSAVLFDRIVGVASNFLLVFIIVALVMRELYFLGYTIYVLLITPIAFFIFMYLCIHESIVIKICSFLEHFKFHGIGDKIKRFYLSIVSFKQFKSVLFLSFGVSMLVQLFYYTSFYAIAHMINMNVPWRYFLIFSPIIAMISLLPISINGIGVRESGNIFFFTKIGATANQAFSFSLLIFIMLVIEGLIGGIINLLGKYDIKK